MKVKLISNIGRRVRMKVSLKDKTNVFFQTVVNTIIKVAGSGRIVEAWALRLEPETIETDIWLTSVCVWNKKWGFRRATKVPILVYGVQLHLNKFDFLTFNGLIPIEYFVSDDNFEELAKSINEKLKQEGFKLNKMSNPNLWPATNKHRIYC